jgi:hypothetical protein
MHAQRSTRGGRCAASGQCRTACMVRCMHAWQEEWDSPAHRKSRCGDKMSMRLCTHTLYFRQLSMAGQLHSRRSSWSRLPAGDCPKTAKVSLNRRG